jgi:hypothetical protein
VNSSDGAVIESVKGEPGVCAKSSFTVRLEGERADRGGGDGVCVCACGRGGVISHHLQL